MTSVKHWIPITSFAMDFNRKEGVHVEIGGKCDKNDMELKMSGSLHELHQFMRDNMTTFLCPHCHYADYT